MPDRLSCALKRGAARSDYQQLRLRQRRASPAVLALEGAILTSVRQAPGPKNLEPQSVRGSHGEPGVNRLGQDAILKFPPDI